MGTRDEDFWWDWLGYEQANLRSALRHSRSRSAQSRTLRLAATMGWFCYTRGQIGEGRDIVGRVLQRVDGRPPPDSSAPSDTDALAAALLPAGILAWNQGDFDRATSLLARSLQLGEATDDVRRVAIASAFLGHVARDGGRYDAAAAHHLRARDLHESAGNQRGVAWAQYDLGLLAWRRGELDRASALLHQSLQGFREIGYA